jgi:hypothetical protein
MLLLCDETLNGIMIKEQYVVDTISNISINKVVGPDTISHKMLKVTAKNVSKPLCLLFNRSLSEKICLQCWKVAHVLPLSKTANPFIVFNYRPPLLLSCVSKIMEELSSNMFTFF